MTAKKDFLEESLVPVPENPLPSEDFEPVDDEVDVAPVEETISEEETEGKGRKRKKRDKKYKLKFRTKQNDIRYLGPLSYRYVRILAWICLAIAQLGTVLAFAQKIDPSQSFNYDGFTRVTSLMSSLPLALFILANFGIILRNRNNFRYLFIFYGGVMLLMYVLGNLVVLHYVYGTIKILDSSVPYMEVSKIVGTFLANAGHTGYIFNLFVDLFICVLTVFFFFYTPKTKAFQGKKIILFRLMILIPIFYEIGSLVIKHLLLWGTITIPTLFFFLLTSKPPFTFAGFIIITLILKIREHKFLKLYNFDYHLLEEHYATNAHSLRTSITIAVVFSIVGTVDVIVFLIYAIVQAVKLGLDEDSLFAGIQMATNIGLGGSFPLFIIAPGILLYSYTRVHKNKKFDSFVPIIGIVLVVFTVFEGFYLTFRIIIPKWIEKFTGSIEDMMILGDALGDEPIEMIRHNLHSFISLGR